jgi:hypothetical protein
MIRKVFNCFFFCAGISLLASACLTMQNSYNRITPGRWRGVLELEKFRIPVRDKDTVILLTEKFKENELPFNFEVTYTDETHFFVEILNGTERIRCDSIRFGRDRTTARDTVNIYFSEYQTYLHADVRGGVMQGEWVVPTKENYRIPFYAHAGRSYRFTDMKEMPKGNISGQWATQFGIEGNTPENAVAEFQQEGNQLSGTFRTETGDYRFLEGTVQGGKFWLSAFDGAHAFLFTGRIQGDTLMGEFRSGSQFRTLWKAWRQPGFDLGKADSLTYLKPNAGIQFQGKTPEGKQIAYPSAEFNGKVGIFTLMGTWCPNCRDEQNFLRDLLQQHPDWSDKIRIVSLAFERHKTEAAAQAQIQQYRNKMGIPFDIVYAGDASKDSASRLFPGLNKVMAFPTMIVVDKKGAVQYIHTGFDGPATSRYDTFKKDFEKRIQELIQR